MRQPYGVDVEADHETEKERTRRELSWVKPGDTLTRFGPPLSLEIVFEVAGPRMLIGWELHAEADGMRYVWLVGHLNDSGSAGGGGPPVLDAKVYAARKAWLG